MSLTFKIVNGDVVFDKRTGRPVMIVDAAKLSQDIGENLNIATQPSGFGASLDALIGLVGDPFALRAELSRRVRSSIRAMQRLQQQFQRAARPANERIASIAAISVSQILPKGESQPSKTAFGYRVDVLTDAATQPSSGSGVIIGQG